MFQKIRSHLAIVGALWLIAFGQASIAHAQGFSAPPKAAPLREVVSKVSPAVVTIELTGKMGSGLFIDDEGTVVTNFHVIVGTTEGIVVMPDESKAKIIG